jgi:zinc transport system substrate-binding protein
MGKLAVALSVLLAMPIAAGCRRSPAGRPGGKVQVVATIFPLADAVRQVGGDRVSVTCMLPPGRSVHDYDPSPQGTELLAGAELVFMIGLGADDWAERTARSAAGSRATIIRLGEAEDFKAMLRASPSAAHDDRDKDHQADQPGRHRHEGDPHVWLDPVFMQHFAAAIAEALAKADPEGREYYDRRRDALVAELKKLDEEYRTTIAALKRRQFVTFHEAFGYVAARYGLELKSLADVDAREVGAARREEVSRFIRGNQVKAIFVEPQFPVEALEQVAGEAGAKVRVRMLDDLGNPDKPGYDSYLGLMRSNLKTLAESLGD